MRLSATFFLVAGLVAQQVTATGWNDASAYSCPGNTKNHCSPDQQNGYDWSNLQPGSFSSYGSNQFSGFTCSNSFGKRDTLTKRGFQSKCITGNLDDSPSMSGDAFSIDQMQISSSQDADIELHYGMPDGSTCKEVQSCSTKGSVFKNTQCGGAKTVTFKPGKNAPHGCQIGVHKVGFHCGSPRSKPPSTPSTSVSAQSVPPTSAAPPPCYGKYCVTSSTLSPPAPSPPCYGNKCSSSPVAPVSSSTLSPPCYGGQCSPSSSTVLPTSSSPSPPCYGGQCSPSSTTVLPTTNTGSPPCYGSSCSTTSVAPVSSSPPPSPTPGCPDVLPRCLKTWMFLTKCKDNSDHKCFCPSENFIKNVMSCLSAWSGSDSETAAAASYLMGICAASVPKNPAIVTACPSGITPGPPTPVASSPAQKSPPCTTVTYSTITVTVPKVEFTTKTITVAGKTSCSVGLGAPTPNNAPAYTTPSQSPPPAYTTPSPSSSVAPVHSAPSPYPSAGAASASKSYGTSWVPKGSASASPFVPPPANAGAKFGSSTTAFVLVVVAGLFAL